MSSQPVCKTPGSCNPSSRTKEYRGENETHVKLDSAVNYNPMHGRKTTGRFPGANRSVRLILLDGTLGSYLPALALTVATDVLSDRVAFLSDELELFV